LIFSTLTTQKKTNKVDQTIRETLWNGKYISQEEEAESIMTPKVLNRPPPPQDDANYGPHQRVENRDFPEEEEVLEELASPSKRAKKDATNYDDDGDVTMDNFETNNDDNFDGVSAYTEEILNYNFREKENENNYDFKDDCPQAAMLEDIAEKSFYDEEDDDSDISTTVKDHYNTMANYGDHVEGIFDEEALE